MRQRCPGRTEGLCTTERIRPDDRAPREGVTLAGRGPTGFSSFKGPLPVLDPPSVISATRLPRRSRSSDRTEAIRDTQDGSARDRAGPRHHHVGPGRHDFTDRSHRRPTRRAVALGPRPEPAQRRVFRPGEGDPRPRRAGSRRRRLRGPQPRRHPHHVRPGRRARPPRPVRRRGRCRRPGHPAGRRHRHPERDRRRRRQVHRAPPRSPGDRGSGRGRPASRPAARLGDRVGVPRLRARRDVPERRRRAQEALAVAAKRLGPGSRVTLTADPTGPEALGPGGARRAAHGRPDDPRPRRVVGRGARRPGVPPARC